MDGLMAVPYKELQKKLTEHKEEKAKRKQQTKRLSSRASKISEN